MVAFTFVLKKDGGSWNATRVKDEEGAELTAEADDTYRCHFGNVRDTFAQCVLIVSPNGPANSCLGR